MPLTIEEARSRARLTTEGSNSPGDTLWKVDPPLELIVLVEHFKVLKKGSVVRAASFSENQSGSHTVLITETGLYYNVAHFGLKQ